MTHHTLRSWPQFFQAIKAGKKTHDLRETDRDFAVGDTATLEEFNPITGTYTGDRCDVEITYITDRDHACAFSSAVLDRRFCILSIQKTA
ncbi:hypothetical protein IZ6_24680 [Terrihabitans soli]|uniref:DUF3850 domain-containing protein n=1 Tax=Terrihabitans soli TaxID=708113 RepID=A0A6S6QKB0_9HYPH|nr:hypothetical protein IZ6_24680 [Terrihabitans soli]